MNEQQVAEALRIVLETLQERGWSEKFSSGPGTPLNIRSAISVACNQLTRSQTAWWALYRSVAETLRDSLQDGIMSWEGGTHVNHPRPRTQSEVERMLTEVIGRLENRIALNPAGPVRDQAGGAGRGAHATQP